MNQQTDCDFAVCVLQASAEAAARLDSGMQYPAEVGVNAYVRLRLSFLGKQVSGDGVRHPV